jgi:hypothetical protein
VLCGRRVHLGNLMLYPAQQGHSRKANQMATMGGLLGWMGCGCSWDMRSSKVERQLTMEGPVGSMDVSGCGIHGDDTVRLLLLCFNTASLKGLVSSCGGKCVRPM